MERAFRNESVLAVEVAVIGGKHDDCIFYQTELFKSVKNPSDVRIKHANHSVVKSDIPGKVRFGLSGEGGPWRACVASSFAGNRGSSSWGALEVRRIVVVFSRMDRRHDQVVWIVHLGIWLWAGIKETSPAEERFILPNMTLYSNVGPLGDPSVVVILLRDIYVPCWASQSSVGLRKQSRHSVKPCSSIQSR